MLIADLYEIKNMFAAVALGGILAAFPAVTGTFAFGYTLDGYMLAFLLSTLAVYLTHKYKWGFIPGIFAMGFATGIYQSYFFTGALLAITVCMLALSEGKEWKKVLSSAWRYAAMGLGGYVFYLIALKIMLAVKHVTLSGYQGTDKVMGLSFSTIIPPLPAFRMIADGFIILSSLSSTRPLVLSFIGAWMVTTSLTLISSSIGREGYSLQWDVPEVEK